MIYCPQNESFPSYPIVISYIKITMKFVATSYITQMIPCNIYGIHFHVYGTHILEHLMI